MRSLRCRSTRDILLAAGLISVISLYITYQLGAPLVQKTLITGSSSWLNSQLQREQLRRLSQLIKQKGATSDRQKSTGATLEKRLLQLEQKMLQTINNVGKVAVIRGQKCIIQRDFPIYKRALLKHGFNVLPLTEKNRTANETDDEYITSKIAMSSDNWTLLLCMSYTDGISGNCLEKSSYSILHPHQKVNRIPGIRNTLWRKDSFCDTMMIARRIPAVRRSQLSPLCFILPNQAEQFVHVADVLGEDSKWIIKSLIPGENIELIENLETFGATKLKELSMQKTLLIQQYFPNPFLVFGTPISLRVYVLVTSVAPLRSFLFNEGLVHFRHDHAKGFKKILNRTWLLSQLWHYIARSFGQSAVSTIIVNLQTVLVQTLLIAETMITAHVGSLPNNDEKQRCQYCFQLLGFDVIFNSTFHPVVLEVNGQPNLQQSAKDEGWAINRVKRGLADSLLSLLYGSTSTAHSIMKSIQECAENIGIMGLNCHISNDLCLTEDDLIFLMDRRRENLNAAGFKQLYPSLGSENLLSFIQDLEVFSNTPKVSSGFGSLFRESSRHSTADLHNLIMKLDRCHNNHLSEEDYSEDAALWNGINVNATLQQFDSVSYKAGFQDLLFRPPCSEDPVTMPYLLNISSEPQLKLTPPFSSIVVGYTAQVPYDQLMIAVWAYAQNCQSEARLDDKFGPSQSANYTLGLGDNQLTFVVVDIRHTEPWVINSYSLVIHRMAASESQLPFDLTKTHEVCALKQDCELQVVSNDRCGLQKENEIRNWTHYDTMVPSLPHCDQGDAPGRWLLPCTVCSERSSCFWHEALWAPFTCQHPYVAKPTLSDCLNGKKLLFIGDSTNRGIMHYLMERLNGTLADWDKTHHMKVYSNLNGGRTNISFAYYPQFWLPTNERPMFDKALHQLLQSSQPLENNSNTILMVGGVHWLAIQHLHMLLQALHKDRLQGIRIVIKTLGSGFHLPVDGVHFLSEAQQKKLLQHNRGLSDFAKHYHFDVIDTFNITIPRFRDFLQGKCACHFHKVVPVSDDPPTKEYRYHVEGPVNAVYSEILISRLCGSHLQKRNTT